MEIDIYNNRPRKIKCIRNDDDTWGVNENNHLLEVDKVYTLKSLEVHNWYTVVYLEEFPGVKFNSVSFEEVE